MAFTYGFYNSKGGDRKYNADQMGNLFDGILNDGVFDNVGNIFATVPGEGLQVLVKSGRAWFNKTWSYNDAAYPIYLERPDVAVPRIDAIVLEVDRRETHRRNRIGYVKGMPSIIPTKPTLTNTDLIRQYPLSYVTVRAGTSSINSSDIEIRVGQSDCPFVTGILQTANIDDLFAAWNEQFTTWFEGVNSQLEGDVAANLLKEIQLRVPIADKSTKENSEALKDDTKWMTPLQTKYAIEKNPKFGNITAEDGTVYKFKKYLNYFTSKQRVVTELDAYENNISSFCYYRVKISPNKKFLVVVTHNGSNIVLTVRSMLASDFPVLFNINIKALTAYITNGYGEYESQNISFFVTDTAVCLLCLPKSSTVSSAGVYMHYEYFNLSSSGMPTSIDSSKTKSQTIAFSNTSALEIIDHMYDCFSPPINRRYAFTVVSSKSSIGSSAAIAPTVIRIDMETGFTTTASLGVPYKFVKYTRLFHSDENTLVVFTACNGNYGGINNDYSIIVFDTSTLGVKFRKEITFTDINDDNMAKTMLYCITASTNNIVTFLQHPAKGIINSYLIDITASSISPMRMNNSNVGVAVANYNFTFDSPVDSKTPDKSKIVCIYGGMNAVNTSTILSYTGVTSIIEFNVDGSIKNDVNYTPRSNIEGGVYVTDYDQGESRSVVFQYDQNQLSIWRKSVNSLDVGPIIPDYLYPLRGLRSYVKFGALGILSGVNTIIPLLEKQKGDETI